MRLVRERSRAFEQRIRAHGWKQLKATESKLNNASAIDSRASVDRMEPPPADARAPAHRDASVRVHPHARGTQPRVSGEPRSAPAASAAGGNGWKADALDDPCSQLGWLKPGSSKPTTRLPSAEANQDARGNSGSTGTTGKSSLPASLADSRLAQAPFTGSFQRKPASRAR